ncbi:flagellar hook-basal body complex protein FliE [Schnuerera sp. xch1]|uniref:flagellar hook-basal body complex protein FliE n=1 Tax=Schnuerera sp. xch1 TaxID=2874283 RepID=UPI001CBD80D1|nr:flagellar hook-basal body complex protein FliE [Schnuerera sp. xch1]MBZ2173880.1 flagellar hook-basal body complex protein FliE [Schnuerera sp. xch1]
MQVKNIDINNILGSDIEKAKGIKQENDGKFSSFLNTALDRVNELQLVSSEYKKLLATGDVDNLHNVTIAAEKANIALQLTLAIRNKVTEAYKEIMRIQI